MLSWQQLDHSLLSAGAVPLPEDLILSDCLLICMYRPLVFKKKKSPEEDKQPAEKCMLLRKFF